MSISFKNITKNTLPSIFVVAIATFGALAVHDAYFSTDNPNADIFANFEPAAGEFLHIEKLPGDDVLLNPEGFPPYPQPHTQN